MNLIWTILLLSSITAMLFVNPDGAITAMVNGSTNAVSLALNLIATYGLWLGFFALLEKTGVTEKVNRLLSPLINFLFPGASKETASYISLNMSANLLGLGNASTPMGIKAINSMQNGKDYASTNMIMLTVISATSIQLIPSTVIGMRITRGSTFPTAFLAPSIIATITSTVVGIALVKILSRLLPSAPKPLSLVKPKFLTKRKNAV